MVKHDYFEGFIMVLIIGNVVILGLQHDDISQSDANMLQYLNYFFSAAFLIEAILKIYAMHLGPYLHNSWNKLDIIVVIAGAIEILMDEFLIKYFSLSFVPNIIQIFRIFRVLRIIKLVKSLEGLKKLIGTLIFSLPSLINASSLIFLSYYMFSILFSFLFYKISFKDDQGETI
jgi:hypothetical protein